MDGKQTGQFLGNLRKQRGLKQREVAEAIQVSDKAVSRWETGRGIPDVDSLERLSRFYEVSINEILAGRCLNEGELKEAADSNLRDMGKKAFHLKKSLFGAIAGIIVLMMLLGVLAFYVFWQAMNPDVLGIMTGKSYSASEMDQFYQKIAELERSEKKYKLTVDTEGKTITIIVSEFVRVGKEAER